MEGFQAKIRELSPQNDVQRRLQSRALETSDELSASRWLLIMENTGSLSLPLLVALVFWLSLIFTAWSVFAPATWQLPRHCSRARYRSPVRSS